MPEKTRIKKLTKKATVQVLAERFYKNKILPDRNPNFVEKVCNTISVYRSLFLNQHTNNYRHIKDIKLHADSIKKKLDSFEREFNRFMEQVYSYGEIVRLYYPFEYKKSKEIVNRLVASLESLQADLNQKRISNENFYAPIKNELQELSDYKSFDKITMAKLIWDLKGIIEEEIKVRGAQGLRLSPSPKKRDLNYPSYRRQWELISKIINEYFPTNLTVDDKELDSHSIPFPFTEQAIRQFANRYRSK